MTPEQYAYFVTLFAMAKEARDFELADDVRAILKPVQAVSDQAFIKMHREGRFTWHPVFSNGQRIERHV